MTENHAAASCDMLSAKQRGELAVLITAAGTFISHDLAYGNCYYKVGEA